MVVRFMDSSRVASTKVIFGNCDQPGSNPAIIAVFSTAIVLVYKIRFAYFQFFNGFGIIVNCFGSSKKFICS